jgi:hypothetical protein
VRGTTFAWLTRVNPFATLLDLVRKPLLSQPGQAQSASAHTRCDSKAASAEKRRRDRHLSHCACSGASSLMIEVCLRR